MKAKDYVKIALWSLLYVVMVVAAVFLGFVHPFWWVYSALPLSVLGAWPYLCLTRRYSVFGMAIVPAVLTVAVSLLAGEGDWLFISIAIGIALVAEAVRKVAGGYRSKRSIRASYQVFALLPFSISLRMWIWPEASMDATIDEMGLDYASQMAVVIAPWMLAACVAATLCLAWISIRMVDRDTYFSLFGNARKPRNTWMGRLMISGMNVAHARVSDWAMDLLQLKDERVVLDMGCGGGRNIRKMGEKLPDAIIYGIDYSPACIEKSRLTNRKAVHEGRAIFTEGQVQNLPYDDGMFDLVTAFETVYFWPEIAECFRGVNRVLRRGGRFMVVCEVNDPLQGAKWEKMVGGMTTYTTRQIEQAMLRADFTDVESHERGTWMAVIGTK